MWLGGIQHNAEWKGRDDLASYALQLQDSEKVYNNFINMNKHLTNTPKLKLNEVHFLKLVMSIGPNPWRPIPNKRLIK